MSEEKKHQSHPAIINRLKRAEGHLSKVIEMIGDEQPCLKIAQQLQAVESAISNAKRTLIQDHLDHCLVEVAGPLTNEQRDELNDLKSIAKYL